MSIFCMSVYVCVLGVFFPFGLGPPYNLPHQGAKKQRKQRNRTEIKNPNWAQKIEHVDFRTREVRNRPQDHDFRNLREKLYRIQKFLSKCVAWGPVSWPCKDFSIFGDLRQGFGAE